MIPHEVEHAMVLPFVRYLLCVPIGTRYKAAEASNPSDDDVGLHQGPARDAVSVIVVGNLHIPLI